MCEEKFMTAGKKLLILGGSSGTEIVEQAKRMGVYTIVADIDKTNHAKEIADEAVYLNTNDFAGIKQLIEKKSIDGVFCGPSEFNLQNAMQVCNSNGLPFYATQKQWDICQNKLHFKELCRNHNVPCIPEYSLTEEFWESDLKKIRYPVVVKPVDGRSSIGVSICKNDKELHNAVYKAILSSKSKQFLVEKCITSDFGFGCRYIANDGEIYLSAVCDRYTVDTVGEKALISSSAIFPSTKIQQYIQKIHPNVVDMFKSIGIKNGTFFMQALVDQEDDQIYFHEMGLRLSGGLIFSMLEAACGYNDVQMMIRYALGGPMATKEEITRIDPFMHNHYVGSLAIPLKDGTIGSISGISQIKRDRRVLDFAQYYFNGGIVKPEYIGTLSQHFCRVKLITDSIDEYKNLVNWIQDTIQIRDIEGKNMLYRRFDTNRIK